MNGQEVTIIDLFLRDPETGEKLEIVSPLQVNESKNSFEVRNPRTGTVYRHTFTTEEV